MAAAAVLVAAALLLSGCSSPSASSSTVTTTGPKTAAGASPRQAPMTPPVVPAKGAYLGAWLNPDATPGDASFSGELAALPTVEAALGRPPGILHVYVKWEDRAPLSDLKAIASAGAIPMLDWGCAPDGAAVGTGADDALITAFATALRSYAGPVLLRWCWEMNLVRSHPEVGGPSGFTDAWVHIRSIFTQLHVTNVSFVWSPALTGADPTGYFPGIDEVDWIAVDGYDRDGSQTFASLFSPFYAQWSGEGLPMMVAETGATGPAQRRYLASIGTGLPSMPDIKAVVYFDAPGPRAVWSLTPAGLRAFGRLAHDRYFARP